MDYFREYIAAFSIMTQKEQYAWDGTSYHGEPENFQAHIDKAGHILIGLRGKEAVSNYGHDLWAGHFYQFMKIYGNLMRFAQDGVEAVNIDLKIRFLKHSQKGQREVGGVHYQPFDWLVDAELFSPNAQQTQFGGSAEKFAGPERLTLQVINSEENIFSSVSAPKLQKEFGHTAPEGVRDIGRIFST
jgi:hypothetical protein